MNALPFTVQTERVYAETNFKKRNMSKTIKSSGGIAVRLIEAINGFRTKYGCWPSKIQAEDATVAHLATVSLTPLGFFLLQSKLEIVIGKQAQILVLGDRDEIFDYGKEGWQKADGHRHDAKQWLGLDD